MLTHLGGENSTDLSAVSGGRTSGRHGARLPARFPGGPGRGVSAPAAVLSQRGVLAQAHLVGGIHFRAVIAGGHLGLH